MDIEAMKKRILDRLAALGLNPNSASEAAGLDRDFIRNILRGKSREPSAERSLKIAKALQCRLEWLLTGEGPVSDEVPFLTPQQQALLGLFEGMPPDVKARFLKVGDALAQPIELDENSGERRSG